MITKFDNYSYVNESRASKWAGLAIYLTLLFNSLRDINLATKPNNFSYDFFIKYLEMMDVANKNPMIQEAIHDFKHKVVNDPKILNKQVILKTIDETPIVFRKNDQICYALYQNAKSKYTTASPTSWCTTFSDPNDTTANAKSHSVIFLSQEADYYEVIHELSHAIEKVIKVDPIITQPFNFNMTFDRLNTQFALITNLTFTFKGSMDKEYIEYLKNPSEVYARINSFKMFLYRNKLIKTPNENVTDSIIEELLTGKIWEKLDENKQKEFIEADFLDLIVFIDVRKNKELNDYIQKYTIELKRLKKL